MGINEEGYWIYEFYNTEDILTDVNGEPVAALAKTERGHLYTRLRLNEKDYLGSVIQRDAMEATD